MLAMAATMALGFSSGAMAEEEYLPGIESKPISNGDITPYIISGENEGGNRTCDEVATAYSTPEKTISYLCGSEKIDYEDFTLPSANVFENINTIKDADGNDVLNPDCGKVSVTTDGTFVSWQGYPAEGLDSHDGLAAIVKGSNDANTYVYLDGSVDSDSGLASPVNNSEDSADLSNLTFCWNPGLPLDSDPPELCYAGETAWSGGNRYVMQGNWATYTAYNGNEYTVSLNAGQTLTAGSVTFPASNLEDKTIIVTVTLNPGWRFQPPKEDETSIDNVKIQDYAATPAAVNPAPGSFAYKTFGQGSTATIVVPKNKFYGVHVDVEREIPCPVKTETAGE